MDDLVLCCETSPKYHYWWHDSRLHC